MKEFIKRETVFVIAVLLAVVSAFFVPPNRAYFDYIDWNTLLLLFGLMAVMAGFQNMGLFEAIGNRLLRKVKNTRWLLFILVFLPFCFAMAITNDVALITFVPFGIVVLRMCRSEELLVPLVVMQTIAANMGSMLTPMGNPQNLYLYAQSQMPLSKFLLLMLPYTVIAGIVLALAILLRKKQKISIIIESAPQNAPSVQEQKVPAFRPDALHMSGYMIGFFLCLLSVAKVLPPFWSALMILLFMLLTDRKILARVDYALLGTFIGFFIFIGNMGSLEGFRNFLSRVINGNELLLTVLSSQIISNVPAVLLLSGFTDNWDALIIGCNLGGLGTLIASMASLISYKQIATEYPQKKGQYFLCFTLGSIGMLAVLLLCHLSILQLSAFLQG